jgi:myo-inositol-hexaphosphate 3-phosphohydrolase
MITVTNSPATGYTTTSGPLDVATVLDAPTAEGNNGSAGASLYFDRVTNMVVTFYANPQGYPAAYSMEPPGGGNIVAAILTNWNFQVRVQQ